MKDRIKKLRKDLDLTQQGFADRLHIKRGAIANYELGRNVPVDSVISLICREFNVNEDWLRNGTGEMFIEMDDEDRMMEDLGRILGHGTAFQKRFVKAFLAMTDSEWKAAEAFLKVLIDQRDESEN